MVPQLTGMERVGIVAELWCYPVKSMRGHAVSCTELDEHGLVDDRRYAFSSTAAAIGAPMVHSRERAKMLRYLPTPGGDTATVRSPAGERFRLTSPELIEHLESTLGEPESHFRLDYDPAPFTDVRPISLVSTATLRGIGEEFGERLDPQRFRTNIVLTLDDDAAFAEDAFCGRNLRFGSSETKPSLQILERIPRCSVVALDPETLVSRRELLTLIARRHDNRLGIYARVAHPAPIAVGDVVFLD